MLKKITDGAGNETQFSQYNAWAKPCKITDINGVATDFTYDVMGRIKTKTSAGLTTSYDYDNAGNLTAVHLPGQEISAILTHRPIFRRKFRMMKAVT